MLEVPADLRCSACQRRLPSRFWFRAPSLCVDCFGRLAEEEKAAIVSAWPVPPFEIPEEPAPIPERITFRRNLARHLMAFIGFAGWLVGAAFVFRQGDWFLFLLGVFFILAAGDFAWSYLRSPHRIEKRGNQLHATFLGGRSEVWNLDGLTLRSRRRTSPPSGMVELLDSNGERLAEVWLAYLSNAETFKRMIPFVERR